MNSKDFLRELVSRGLIQDAAARRAEVASSETGTRIEHTLLEFGLIGEDALFHALAKHLGMPFLKPEEIDHSLCYSLPLKHEFLKRLEIVPAAEDENGIVFATSDPGAGETLSSIAFHLGREVHPAVASPSTIKAALATLSETGVNGEDSPTETDIERLRSLANEGPIIELVTDLINQGATDGASDIHIEAEETVARVRFRIDGALRTIRTIPTASRAAVVSRLKVMANLNISEKRRPQDGRVQVSVRGRRVDIRMSTLPTQFGESIVLRLLDRSRVKLDWDALGFSSERVGQIERIVSAPNGIFLVAGPTGSGKTTTLYTALNKINSDDKKIVTVEDPIEFSLSGINQVQVDPEIDMTFARALRAILRQDPDVVMVGEIRDHETAEIAVRAALVGRMVLSTIHTNNSLAAIDRLLDLGIPRYLLSATLRGVLSQRLVQRLCASCRGVGCQSCGDTGRHGRVVVSELLTVTPEVASCLSRPEDQPDLEQTARNAGFVSLLEDGQRLKQDSVVAELDIQRALGAA